MHLQRSLFEIAAEIRGASIPLTRCPFSRWCSSDVKYTASWSKETAFGNILISPKMITDHMPDIVLKALNSLAQENAPCISCRAQEDFSTNIV